MREAWIVPAVLMVSACAPVEQTADAAAGVTGAVGQQVTSVVDLPQGPVGLGGAMRVRDDDYSGLTICYDPNKVNDRQLATVAARHCARWGKSAVDQGRVRFCTVFSPGARYTCEPTG